MEEKTNFPVLCMVIYTFCTLTNLAKERGARTLTNDESNLQVIVTVVTAQFQDLYPRENISFVSDHFPS
jgi:hypothetical protein